MMNLFIFLIPLLFINLAQAELNPNVNSFEGEGSKPEALIFMEEIDKIKPDLAQEMSSSRKIKWDIRDVALVAKVQNYGDLHVLKVFRAIKSSSKLSLESLNDQQELYDLAKHYNPPLREAPLNSDSLENVSVSLNVGVISFSAPLSGQLSDDQRLEVLSGIKEMQNIYNSPQASEGQKYLIANFLKDYLDYDVTLSEDQILNSNDGDLVQYKALMQKLGNGFEDFEKGIKNHFDIVFEENLQKEALIIAEYVKLLEKKIDQESNAILDVVGKTNRGVQVGVIQANLKLDYLKQKEHENQVKQQIATITNADKLSELIEATKACDAKDPNGQCAALKKQEGNMKVRLQSLKQSDRRHITKRGLNLAYDLALLTKDQDTAKHIARAIKTYDSVVKISDLALGLSSKTAMAAAGDIMSMASLSISIAKVFGSSGGLGSADEAILEQLRQIRIDIQSLRKQMHERFDILTAEIRHMGIGLNLKLDMVSDNVGVVAKNQSLIKELVDNNSFKIAELAQVQSSNTIHEVAQNLDQYNGLIQSWNDPDRLSVYFLEGLTEFSSYLKYNAFNSLTWPGSKFDLASPEALVLVSQINQNKTLGDFAGYGLIDYLVKNSVTNKLGGDCSELNFNNVYLFNVLGAQVLKFLRSEFENPPSNADSNLKYKYVLKHADLSKKSSYQYFKTTLDQISNTMASANRCMNRFARSNDNSKDVNVMTYLLASYQKELEFQKDKIRLALSEEGHAKGMKRVLMDSTARYFGGLEDHLINLSSEHPERRKRLDLSLLNFDKPGEERQKAIDEKFYEKYKYISMCERNRYLEIHSYIKPTKDKYWNFKLSNYPEKIELSPLLLKSIFPKPEMRTALALNLNEVRICYNPNIWGGYDNNMWIPSMLMKVTKDLRKDIIILNEGRMPSIFAMTLVIESTHEPIKKFKAAGNKANNRYNSNLMNEKVISTELRVFIPTKDVKLSSYTPKLKINDIDASNLNVLTDLKPRQGVFLHYSELSKYLTSKFKIANWKCEDSSITGFSERCYVEGSRPYDEQLLFWGHSEGLIYNDGNFGLHPYTYTTGLWSYFDIEKSNVLREQLKATNFNESLKNLESDFNRCYFRLLLGYSDCEFAGRTSLMDQKHGALDWTKLNQIDSLIRTITSQLIRFKKGISEKQKMEFNYLLDRFLTPPAYTAIDLSLKYPDDLSHFYSSLEVELEAKDKDFQLLLERSEQILEINLQDFLNMDIYSDLKYFHELSNI